MDEIVYIILKSSQKIDQINAVRKYRLVRKKAPKAIESELKIIGFNFLPSDLELKHRVYAINSVEIENNYKKFEMRLKTICYEAYAKIKDLFSKILQKY